MVVGTQHGFIIICHSCPSLFPGGGHGLLLPFIMVGARPVFVVLLFHVGFVWHRDMAVPSPLKGGVMWGMLAINHQLAVDSGGVVLARWLVIEVEGTAYHIKHEPMTTTLSLLLLSTLFSLCCMVTMLLTATWPGLLIVLFMALGLWCALVIVFPGCW